MYLHKTRDLMSRLWITQHTLTVLQACGLTMQPRWPWCHSPPALHEVRRSTSMFSSLTVATQTNMPPPSPSFFFSSFSSSKVGKLIEERACACVITCHYTMEMVLLQSFKSNIPAVVHKFLPFFFFFPPLLSYRGNKAGEEFPLQPGSQWSLLHALTWVSPDSF